VAFAHAEPGVQDGQLLAEALLDLARQRRHQGDLGDEEDDGPVRVYRRLRGPQVDLGLARAGHALKKEGSEVSPLEDPHHLAQGKVLVRTQDDRLGPPIAEAHHVAVHREALDLGELVQDAEVDQPADHRRRAADGGDDLGGGGRPSHGVEIFDDRLAGGGASGHGEMRGEAARGQLDAGDVAGRSRLERFARNLAALGQIGENGVQVGDSHPGLQLGHGRAPGFTQGFEDEPLIARMR
jgi:hypothetical protein